MIPFAARFGEVADREPRVVTVTQRGQPVPPDRYAFVDLYCDESGCDCRRVLLWVMAGSDQEPVATISFGFDPEADDAGPFLDPLGRQSELSAGLLDLFVHLVNADPAYVERLYRHYTLMREQADGRPYRGRPFPVPWRRRPQPVPGLVGGLAPNRRPGRGLNAPCPCGSGKKRKRCCGAGPAP